MKELKYALKLTFPILLTYLFIGIAFGMMMADAGYSAVWSLISSFFVYAGSYQVVMVSLLQAGAPLATVAIMAFFINGRHIFYGVGFIERFRRMGPLCPYMVLTLTDETYSILCSLKYENGLDHKKTDFFVSALNHSYWVAGSFLGGCMGSYLPWDLTGIDFAATAFFLVVVVNQWRQFKSKIPALTGLASSVVFILILGPDSFLIPALSVSMLALIILKDKTSRQMGVKYE